MSVNKFMHPRNIYKTPPNFKQMAIDYPEFRKHVTQDLTGKIRIDFKNNETLRALTQTLLKKDFGLDVIIPLDRLIPTVPLRLNYILWIEDLLSIVTEEVESEKQDVHGIDIGTGASCVYPLLAAKIHNWHMTANEINSESYSLAQDNVQRNNLQHLIIVNHTSGETLLKNILEPHKMYDFCMCNPPFFSSTSELDPENKSRTERRAMPRNAPSGMIGEVVVPGGEVEFIKTLIMESVELKTQVRIFTTMVGHKCNLAALKQLLRQVEVTSFKQTEFHQGHTTRWGLAWTYYDIDLRKVPQATVAAARKKPKPPLKFAIPPVSDESITLDDVIIKVRGILQTLHMNYEEIKRATNMYALHVTAKENTWSHARRRKREQRRKHTHQDEPIEVDQNGGHSTSSVLNSSTEDTAMDIDTSTETVGHKRHRSDDSGDEGYYNMKKPKVTSTNDEVYLKITLVLRRLASEYHLEMSFVEGSAGRDTVHQVMQYFKNNWK
ncbi:uncharacterized protein CBL_09504 [Carabus blaptoides fortunei]